MNEYGVWRYLQKGMLGRWHATRIESCVGMGIPDVSFGVSGINGWLELKYTPDWPKRDSTKVKLALRPEQKNWIQTRGALSGNVWVFWRISNTFFLLTWSTAISLAEEGATSADLLKRCTRYWHRFTDFTELAGVLSNGN